MFGRTHNSRTYIRVSTNDGKSSQKELLSRFNPHLAKIAICVAIALVNFGIGLYLGRLRIETDKEIFEPFGRTKKTFAPISVFYNDPSNASEVAWESLILSNGGFVMKPEDHSIPLSVTFYHQLHCLHALQLSYYKTKYELDILRNHSIQSAFIGTIDVDLRSNHIHHCFDYLIQTILCAADTNLEPPDPNYPNITDGYWSERSCRDYDAIQKWAEIMEWKAG
ncbi:hypothetical protein HBH98_051370 [Parastagonospora nodorum]|nr:hypothetical protein HBH98_051370 [Parastagonospora nodorum]KAH4363075.1 hypothetical protein HBH97_189100 [Parastagonospora nodorum]KAH4424898.1 hypothetical protein HBH99_038960 [Parastagonospora nodorum]KAH5134527.1 hypothetical protein HBH70_133620 [Parastagonospora nodorum]KAH5319465.1 hypothetical protein HBI12_115080 [Parastagonospora nodorum]